MTRQGKPVNVRRGPLGTWFATRGEREARPGLFEADTKYPIEAQSAKQLEELHDAYMWLKELQHETGKTREEIAAAFGLELTSV